MTESLAIPATAENISSVFYCKKWYSLFWPLLKLPWRIDAKYSIISRGMQIRLCQTNYEKPQAITASVQMVPAGPTLGMKIVLPSAGTERREAELEWREIK